MHNLFPHEGRRCTSQYECDDESRDGTRKHMVKGLSPWDVSWQGGASAQARLTSKIQPSSQIPGEPELPCPRIAPLPLRLITWLCVGLRWHAPLAAANDFGAGSLGQQLHLLRLRSLLHPRSSRVEGKDPDASLEVEAAATVVAELAGGMRLRPQ